VLASAMTGLSSNFVNEALNEVVRFDHPLTSVQTWWAVRYRAWVWYHRRLSPTSTIRLLAQCRSQSVTDHDFVGPYYTTKRAIFLPSRRKRKLTSRHWLTAWARLLVKTHEAWARELGYDRAPYKRPPELLLELENGRVDVIVNDNIMTIRHAKKTGQESVVIDVNRRVRCRNCDSQAQCRTYRRNAA
jgi:hypothetical protein